MSRNVVWEIRGDKAAEVAHLLITVGQSAQYLPIHESYTLQPVVLFSEDGYEFLRENGLLIGTERMLRDHSKGDHALDLFGVKDA